MSLQKDFSWKPEARTWWGTAVGLRSSIASVLSCVNVQVQNCIRSSVTVSQDISIPFSQMRPLESFPFPSQRAYGHSGGSNRVRGGQSSSCSFCLLEALHAVGAGGRCSCKSADLSCRPQSRPPWESGPHTQLCSQTLRPLEEEGLDPLPPSLPPPYVLASHLPLLEPQPHDADTHAPLVYVESICPYLARPAPGWASTSSPAPTGLPLSLRLFEVWLWGPVGVTSNALSG